MQNLSRLLSGMVSVIISFALATGFLMLAQLYFARRARQIEQIMSGPFSEHVDNRFLEIAFRKRWWVSVNKLLRDRIWIG